MKAACGKPAILLDRDGTLIEDRGCLAREEDIKFMPGVLEGLRLLQPHFGFVMITNQPWISRNSLSWRQLTAVNESIGFRLSEAGIHLLGWYACPHTREENCSCIKPKPALGALAAKEHNLDLRLSWTIGDHPHDVVFAESLGARGGLYLLTGHGIRHREDLGGAAAFIAASFMDAAQWLLHKTCGSGKSHENGEMSRTSLI